jgi:hypothetical protein
MVGFGAQDLCPNCGLVTQASASGAERRWSDRELLARLRAAAAWRHHQPSSTPE